MRIAYLDCFNGISGDMTLGAFLDAGLELSVLSKELKKLKIPDSYELRARKVRRGPLAGTKFDCVVKSAPRGHRPLREITALIEKSSLSRKARESAADIFTAIGRAEAKVHGVNGRKRVHLHELGETDSIIDIVGAAIAVDELGIDEVYSSAVTMGRTAVMTKAGVLPVPAPASLELLKGVPVRISGAEAELVTPTGAGILKVLSKGFGRMPAMNVSDIGYGAGSMEPEGLPNMLRVMIGVKQESFREDRVVVMETNIDDMNPQNFEYLFELLFREGALDAYTQNIHMKKSRPAFKLTVLAEPPFLEKLSSIIFRETTSIGLRFYEADRLLLDRKIVKVGTRYGDVKVKMSKGPGGIKTVSPEYEACAALARLKKVPLKAVYEEAKAAAEA